MLGRVNILTTLRAMAVAVSGSETDLVQWPCFF